MNIDKAARVVFYLSLAFAPLGTRYIGYMGNIGGVDIEPGTVSMFGTQIAAIVFVLLSLMAVIDRRGGLPDRKRDPFPIAFLFMIVSVCLSAALSPRFTSSLVAASWIALGAAIFCSVRIVRPSAAVSAIAFMAGGAAQAVLGAFQFAAQETTANKWLGMAAHLPSDVGASVIGTADGRWLRAYGTLSHPNQLGAYLAVAALLAFSFAAVREGRQRRLALAVAVICVFGLALTFSRGAALGLVAGLIALAISAPFRGDGRKIRLSPASAAAVIGLIALVSAYAALGEPAMTRVTAEGRLERISIEERGNQFADALALSVRHPFFGVGPGMMPYALHDMDPGRDPWKYQYVHNTPLLIAVETGIVGIAAWSLFAWFLLRVLRRTAEREADAGRVSFLPALAALAVAGLFDHFLWSSWSGQLMFWCVAALAVAAAVPIPRLKKESGRLVVE